MPRLLNKLRQIADDATSVRTGVFAASALGVIASLSTLAIPWLAGNGVGKLFDDALDAVAWIAVALVGVLALRLVLEIASSLVGGATRFRLIAELRNVWFGRIVDVAPGSEAEARRQEWVSILSYDIPRTAEYLVDLPVSLTRAVVTLVGAGIAMFLISPTLAAIVALLAPLSYFVARLFARQVRQRAQAYWDDEIAAMTFAEESFRSRWTIQAFVQTRRHQRQFEESTETVRGRSWDHLRVFAILGPAIQFVTFAGMVAVIVMSAQFLSSPLGPEQLLSFLLYGLLLSGPLRSFADGYGMLQEAGSTLGRFDAVRELQPERDDGDEVLERVEGRIVLNDVTFGWRDEALLDGASLTIEPAESIALVGPNGVGKTTLVSLLLRFCEPESGTIELDGHDIRTLELDSYRRLIAAVPQHGVLIGGTIRENVMFGAPDARESDVWEALRIAVADEMVRAFPDGLDTRIGEDGLSLSGGERQRVAMARAILTDAPILILDEATSNFDVEAFREFVERASELLAEKTVIWVTHDAEPQRHVDRIVELHDHRFRTRPRIVEVVGR